MGGPNDDAVVALERAIELISQRCLAEAEDGPGCPERIAFREAQFALKLIDVAKRALVLAKKPIAKQSEETRDK